MKRCYGGSGQPHPGYVPSGMFATILLLLVLEFPYAAARADSACAIDPVSGQVTSTANCYIEPDSYRVFIYEVGFCTELPVTPTTSVAFDAGESAVKLYESGSEPLRLEVQNGRSSVLSSLLERPPDGTYTHGYVIMKPEIRLTAQYVSGGTTYYTKAASLDISGFGGALQNIQNAPQGVGPYQASSAVGEYGETVWTMDALGLDDNYEPVFKGVITGGNVYLTAGDYSIATDSAAAYRIVGIIEFGSVTIDDSVTGVDYKFKVTEGAIFQPLGGTNYAIIPGEIKLDARLLN